MRPQALRVLAKKSGYAFDLVQPELGGADDAVYLIRPPPAHDSRRDPRMAQGPSYRDFGGGFAVLGPDLLQQADKLQVAREARFVELWGVPPPVVVGQVLDPLGVIFPVRRPLCIGE